MKIEMFGRAATRVLMAAFCSVLLIGALVSCDGDSNGLGPAVPESSFAGNCDDGIDNDRDGELDADDENCGSEAAENENCADDIDNDGDGATDCSAASADDACHCGDEDFDSANCDDGIDNDGDGDADAADADCACPDADDDGVCDADDNCDTTPVGCTIAPNGCEDDTDDDGVCDGIDACADTGAVCDVDAAGCPLDADNDGVCEPTDTCADTPAGCTVDADGCPADADDDGVCDGVDDCPGTTPGCTVDANGCPAAIDNDADTIADCDDPDDDNDGDLDVADNCPLDANADQADSDGDGDGDVCDTCTDTDDDGFGDPGFTANTCTEDNCPDDINADQANFDADDFGDACDDCTDTDDDGFGNPGFAGNTCDDDNCPLVSNPGQEDLDLDGIGAACETTPEQQCGQALGENLDGNGFTCWESPPLENPCAGGNVRLAMAWDNSTGSFVVQVCIGSTPGSTCDTGTYFDSATCSPSDCAYDPDANETSFSCELVQVGFAGTRTLMGVVSGVPGAQAISGTLELQCSAGPDVFGIINFNDSDPGGGELGERPDGDCQ